MTVGYHVATQTGNWLGGESRDALVDGTIVQASAPAGWSIITTPIATGGAAWECDADGSHAAAPFGIITQGPLGNYITAFMAQIRLSAAPTASFCLAGQDGDTLYALECDTNQKVRLVKLGTTPNRWTNRSALSDWSTTTIPTGSYIHLTLIIDVLTLGSPLTWFALVMGGSEQWTYTESGTGTNSWYPCSNIENVDSGIIVRWDDMAGIVTTTAADAPHLTAWPVAEVHRQLATGDGALTDWAKTGSGSGDADGTYTEWDETTGNDGDTTYNWDDAGVTDRQQASTGPNAAVIGIDGHTVLHQWDDATEGPWLNIVHKNNDGLLEKFAGKAYNNQGTNPTLQEPGTTYEGGVVAFIKSGGWVVGDAANLEFGCEIPDAAQHNEPWHVSLCMMQWLTYTDTLPTTTTPVSDTAAAVTTGKAMLMGAAPGVC